MSTKLFQILFDVFVFIVYAQEYLTQFIFSLKCFHIISGDGTLLSCGDNTYGQLGRTTEGSKLLPVETNFNFKPLSVSAGLGHSLLLCKTESEHENESNAVLSWGWNRSSQLGRQGQEGIPLSVEGLSGEDPIAVSAGRVHSIVLTSKGEVWVWGSGRNGRLGLGSSTDEAEPALLECLEGFQVLQAAAGFDHNLLLVAE